MAYTFTRTGAQIEEIHNTVEDIDNVVGGLTNYQADSVADMITGSTQLGVVSLALGQSWAVDDYYGSANPNNSGVLFFKVVDAGTGTSDGGKYIDVPGGVFQLKQNLTNPVNIKAYGCRLDGVTDDHAQYQSAIDNNKSVFHPSGTAAVSDELVYPATRTSVIGESKDVSFTKWIGPADSLKSVYRLSDNLVGEDPTGTKLQNCTLASITMQCDDKAGFGWYCANANTLTVTDVEVTRALRFPYFALRVFTSTITRAGAFACGDGGPVLGYNLYGWSSLGSDQYTINAVTAYNLTSTGCGFNQTFDPNVDPKLGAGFLFGEGISNNVFGLTVQESTGAGVVTTGNSGVSIYGVYGEKNGLFGGEFYHVYNDAVTNFQNLNTIASTNNIVHANARMHIDGYNAAVVKGPGEVTMTGEFANANVETTRKTSRVIAKNEEYDPLNRTRKRIWFGNNSSFASLNFRGSRVDKWKAYLIFNDTVTIPANTVLEIMEFGTGADKIGESSIIPDGTYTANQSIIVDIPSVDISPYKIGWIRLNNAYAGANHEIGIFAEEYI